MTAASPLGTGPVDLAGPVRSILASRAPRHDCQPPLRCAAVLVPLLLKSGEWHVLVTQRTLQVEHHKGQVSFPGGACDPDDADRRATALRETYEEVGIPPGAIDILGEIGCFPTVSDFCVAAFVGLVPHPFAYRLATREVESVVEVPLSFLRTPDHLRVEWRQVGGQAHEVLFWDYGAYTIWGVTARILKTFLDLLP